MSTKNPLHTVQEPSTGFLAQAHWDGRGPTPGIRYSFVRDGVELSSGITFRRVLSVRLRAERCCTEWHIEGAYDTLVEIVDSPWVAELRGDMDERWRSKWETHHYMIYLDGSGCFEVVAEGWEAIPEIGPLPKVV